MCKLDVKLAGYNVARELFGGCDEEYRHLFTPEVFSSAYAKISRSAKTIPELRKEALKNIEKARELNQKLIFDFGHSSVAEHSVFNIDILGISRLALEYLESVKYGSFTEKSQRYVTFGRDFYIPSVIRDKGLIKRIEAAFQKAYECYSGIINDVFERTKDQYRKQEQKVLMQKIKEDARYILPLCTKSQVGMTINARALEYLISFLCSQGIDELDDLSGKLLGITREVAPSVIKYTDPDRAYCQHSSTDSIKTPCGERSKNLKQQFLPAVEKIRLYEDIDTKILASYRFKRSSIPYSEAYRWATEITCEERASIFDDIFRDIDFYHMMPREFESAAVEFEALVSASCFAQLKRHRESMIIAQDYSWENPVILPSILIESESSREMFLDTVNLFRDIYYDIEDCNPLYRDYFMLNCSSRRVLCRFDMKSLYNFFRLRSDKHSQWEIRYLSNEILERLKAKDLSALRLACGKDRFKSLKNQIYNKKGE